MIDYVKFVKRSIIIKLTILLLLLPWRHYISAPNVSVRSKWVSQIGEYAWEVLGKNEVEITVFLEDEILKNLPTRMEIKVTKELLKNVTLIIRYHNGNQKFLVNKYDLNEILNLNNPVYSVRLLGFIPVENNPPFSALEIKLYHRSKFLRAYLVTLKVIDQREIKHRETLSSQRISDLLIFAVIIVAIIIVAIVFMLHMRAKWKAILKAKSKDEPLGPLG